MASFLDVQALRWFTPRIGTNPPAPAAPSEVFPMRPPPPPPPPPSSSPAAHGHLRPHAHGRGHLSPDLHPLGRITDSSTTLASTIIAARAPRVYPTIGPDMPGSVLAARAAQDTLRRYAIIPVFAGRGTRDIEGPATRLRTADIGKARRPGATASRRPPKPTPGTATTRGPRKKGMQVALVGEELQKARAASTAMLEARIAVRKAEAEVAQPTVLAPSIVERQKTWWEKLLDFFGLGEG